MNTFLLLMLSLFLSEPLNPGLASKTSQCYYSFPRQGCNFGRTSCREILGMKICARFSCEHPTARTDCLAAAAASWPLQLFRRDIVNYITPQRFSGSFLGKGNKEGGTEHKDMEACTSP